MHLNAFNAVKYLIKVRNLGDMLLNILQPQKPIMCVIANCPQYNCLSIFLTAILSGLKKLLFFFQSTFSQTWFPLFLDFHHET